MLALCFRDQSEKKCARVTSIKRMHGVLDCQRPIFLGPSGPRVSGVPQYQGPFQISRGPRVIKVPLPVPSRDLFFWVKEILECQGSHSAWYPFFWVLRVSICHGLQCTRGPPVSGTHFSGSHYAKGSNIPGSQCARGSSVPGVPQRLVPVFWVLRVPICPGLQCTKGPTVPGTRFSGSQYAKGSNIPGVPVCQRF